MKLFSTHEPLPIVFADDRQPQTFEELMQAWRQWALEGRFSSPVTALTEALRQELDAEGFVLVDEPVHGAAVQGGAKLLVLESEFHVRHPDSEALLTVCVTWTVSTLGGARLYVEFQTPDPVDWDAPQLPDVLGHEQFSFNLEVHPGLLDVSTTEWFELAKDRVAGCFARPGGIPSLVQMLQATVMDELRARTSA